MEAHFPPGQDELVIGLPVWTPGSYLVREYARHVQELTRHRRCRASRCPSSASTSARCASPPAARPCADVQGLRERADGAHQPPRRLARLLQRRDAVLLRRAPAQPPAPRHHRRARSGWRTTVRAPAGGRELRGRRLRRAGRLARSRWARTRRFTSPPPACRTRWCSGASRSSTRRSCVDRSDPHRRDRGRALRRAADEALRLLRLRHRQGPRRPGAQGLDRPALPAPGLRQRPRAGKTSSPSPRTSTSTCGTSSASSPRRLVPFDYAQENYTAAALVLRGRHQLLRQPAHAPRRPDERRALPDAPGRVAHRAARHARAARCCRWSRPRSSRGSSTTGPTRTPPTRPSATT